MQTDFHSPAVLSHYPAIIQKTKDNSACREGEEGGKHLMGMSISAVILENTKEVPQKLQIERLDGLATPLLGMRPKEMTQRMKETPACAFLTQPPPPTRSQDVISIGIHQ